MENVWKNSKGFIFDLDGTLLDSMTMWMDVDRRFLRDRGIVVPEDYQRSVASLGFRGTAEYTIRRFGFRDTPEELMKLWDDMALREYECSIPLKPFVLDFLQEASRRGLPMTVASASPRAYIDPALKRLGVMNLFRDVVSVDQVGRAKEFPDIYIEAAKRMNLFPGDCLVFEDALSSMKSAKAAGCRVIAVYDDSGKENWEEAKRFADGAVLHLGELL